MKIDKRWLAVAGLMSTAAIAATASARVVVNLDDIRPARVARSESPANGRFTATFGGSASSWTVYSGYHGSADDASSVAAWNAQLMKATDRLAASQLGNDGASDSFADDVARQTSAAGLDRPGYDANQRDKAKSLPAHLPEPASWALLILGFGGIGFALRRAHRRSEAKFDEKIRRITNGLPD